MHRRRQWVWWGLSLDLWGWGFLRLDPDEDILGSVYEWYLFLGPLEIRKWRCIGEKGG